MAVRTDYKDVEVVAGVRDDGSGRAWLGLEAGNVPPTAVSLVARHHRGRIDVAIPADNEKVSDVGAVGDGDWATETGCS